MTPAARPTADRSLEPGPYPDELVEQIASRVVELLGGGAPLLAAADVARQLGRSREWVYRHADELGAVRLGDGDRPRLGFEPAKVAAYRRACTSSRRTASPAKPGPNRKAPASRRRVNGQGAEYLPIRGEAPPRAERFLDRDPHERTG